MPYSARNYQETVAPVVGDALISGLRRSILLKDSRNISDSQAVELEVSFEVSSSTQTEQDEVGTFYSAIGLEEIIANEA